MEPAEFLRHQPPFDTLRPGAFRLAESALEVAYHARGEVILRRGGPRATHLYVVRKGVVRLERDGQLVQTLEEGDAFAFPSLIGRTCPHVDVIAAEDVLAYRFPADVFEQLMEEGEFREFFLLDLSGRLRRSAALGAPPLGADLGLPARGLVTRAPVTIERGASVGEAARRMRELGVSSILVEGEPVGILTDRDLRSRVLAEGHGAEAPIASVMSSPVVTLEAGASLFDVLMLMLERRVHHVPLVEGGAIVGVLTDTDLLRAQVQSPLALLKRVSAGAANGDVPDYAGELTRMVDSLFGAGLEATRIGRVVSRLNDAYAAGLLRAAEEELGPPPAPYAWIVFGSEGRMEQTLLT
ncbi:MAG: CBS domain-containing protein, partial [Candidatus Eisenbacteria bacterium]|nr:CBS domain-containing protein [Candidatus Eisenbacteria bacterium]